MKKINELLRAARFLDADGTASLSSLLIWVMLLRLALLPVDWPTVVLMLLVLASYNGRKWFHKLQQDKQSSDKARLDELDEKVKKLNAAAQARKM